MPLNRQIKRQESLSGKTQAILIGLILAIIGAIIGNSFAKDSLTNYTGFGMMLAGIAIFVFGIASTAATGIKMRLSREEPSLVKVRKPRVLFVSIWTIGLGVVLTALGYLLSNTFAQESIINLSGYRMLLGGAAVLVVGAAGIILSTAQVHRVKTPGGRMTLKIKQPNGMLVGGLSLGIGIIVTVAGTVVAGSFVKDSLFNYVGFGALLVGVGFLSGGVSQTVVENLKTRWNLNEYCPGENEPRIMLGGIWAICIGAMLVIDGSLIASSYAKTSLMNYGGFGMLLAGTGVFVYGIFQTARISALSAMGYLSSRRSRVPCEPVQKEKLSLRFKRGGRNLVRTSAVFNLAGVMVAMGLLFFSLWQLDLIVSGPVWWQSSPYGQGWSWPGPGAYANDYFQCFLWKTTIGQAYDTLFLLIFISFIVLFVSVFFWSRFQTKEPTKT